MIFGVSLLLVHLAFKNLTDVGAIGKEQASVSHPYLVIQINTMSTEVLVVSIGSAIIDTSL
jgi:UDP-N-acetylglucosamine 2-epimerase